MNDFRSIISLNGRLSRWSYALIALPVLVIFELRYLVVYYGPGVVERLGGDLTSVGWMIAVYIAFDLLLLPLIVASFNRLHDIGLTGFLCLPYVAERFISLASNWAWLHHADANTVLIIQRTMTVLHDYGLALALFLLVFPGRKRATAEVPATA